MTYDYFGQSMFSFPRDPLGFWINVPVKSWDIISPKIWMEDKPMTEEKKEVRIKLPAGTRFSDIVIQFEDSDKEHAVVDASLSYRTNYLTRGHDAIRTLKLIERDNQTVKLELALDAARTKVDTTRRRYQELRQELEEAQREKNRAKSALENHVRGIVKPVNPFE